MNPMQNLFAAVTLLCWSGLPGQISNEQEQRWAALDTWMTTYYLPRPYAEIPKYLNELEESQFLEKNPIAAGPILGFLTILFEDNSERLTSWMSGKSYSPVTKKTLERAVWLSGNQNRMKAIFKEIPDFAMKPAAKLADFSVRSAPDLDICWGAFFASGNEIYIRKIINVLDESHPLSGEAKLDVITRKAAAWSLGSNLKQHEKIYRIVQKEIEQRSDPVKQQLQDLYSSTRKNFQTLPDRDGDFSALLVLTDSSELKEFLKPAEKGVQLAKKEKAKRGDRIAINVLFAGFEANEALLGDVRYDLKILDPDSGLYDNTDEKDIRAFSSFLYSRFRIYNDNSPAQLVFEKDDKLGKYQFLVEIRDNIGKKKISLKGEIELVE